MNEVRDDHVFWLQEAGIRVQGLKFLHGGICIGLWDTTTTPFTISKYVFASKRPKREGEGGGLFAESHRFYLVISKKSYLRGPTYFILQLGILNSQFRSMIEIVKKYPYAN